MTSCPFLKLEQSHCAGCQGWRCLAFGRKKKVSDEDTKICKVESEWGDCPRYLEATNVKPSGIGVLGMPGSMTVIAKSRVTPLPPPQAIQCEYLGMPPDGGTCCHQWCIAGNVSVRSTKVCNSPPSRAECRYYIDGKRRGIKPYASS